MNVQCISERPGHVDVIYGTGAWEFKETKDVPDDVAKKMLDHADVYAKPKTKSAAVAKAVIAPVSKEDPLQEFYDSLAVMNTEQVKSFIETKFDLKLDMSKFKSEQSLRDHARMLVEQYGFI
jgi:hypothetical protein